MNIRSLTLLLASVLLIGCGPKVAQNRDITLRLTETTQMHPVRMSVAVDTIVYTFDRTGLVGTVGHAEMQVLSDNAIIFEDDSRKVLTGFMPTYSFQYVVTEPQGD